MWRTAAPATVTSSEHRPIADQGRCQGMSPVRHVTAMKGPVKPASASRPVHGTAGDSAGQGQPPGMSLAERCGGNRSVIPDTRREAEMSTAQEHGNIPSTAVMVAPGLWRTSLQRYDLSVPGREMIQSRVDVEPGSPPIRHTHPGEEIIYVLAGSLEYQIDGQPTKVYNAGEALTVPAGVIHAVRNTGTGIGTALATDIAERGKPLLTAAQ